MSNREAAARDMRSEAEVGARDRLLKAAERLFAERGFDGVSVREIATAAEVNSASVAYYFRSKEGLLSEVYRRHCEPMNEERSRRSDRGVHPAGAQGDGRREGGRRLHAAARRAVGRTLRAPGPARRGEFR